MSNTSTTTPVNNTLTQTPAPVTPQATEGTEASKTVGSEVKEIALESNGLNFTPAEIRVKLGDKVKLTYKNNRGKHDWTLDEFNAKTKLIEAGQSDTIEFTADKKGSFEYYCSVQGHRQAGMKGTFIVE